MKKLTKFQKQIVVLCCLALVAAVCITVYLVRSRSGEDAPAEPPYTFTEGEIAAIKAFDGSASFAFGAEKGAGDDFTAPLMRLAEGYAFYSSRVSVDYGSGGDGVSVTVNGSALDFDADAHFKTLKDGTPYATDARAFFNKALFGEELGASTDALPGFDLDGDRVNSAGFAYLYGPIEREDIKGIKVKNEFDELTFVPVDGVFYLADTDLDLAAATTSTLVAAVRAPVASGKVASPEQLSAYGLDSDENAKATIVLMDNDDNAYFIRIGKMLTDGSGFYALCPGKDIVYILPSSISNYLLIPKEQFLVANFGTPLEQLTDVFTKIDDVTLNIGGDLLKAELMSDEEKKNHPINYSWKITSPERFVSDVFGYGLPNYGNIGDLYNTLCALASDNVVEADMTDENLKKYGLDDPLVSYSWLYDGTTRCTVYFSRPNSDGDYYVYSEKSGKNGGDKKKIGIGLIKGADFIYGGYTVADYVDAYLYTQYFDKIDSLEFTHGGETHKMTVSVGEDGIASGARLDGKEADLKNCQGFYRGLLVCTSLGEYEGEKPKEIFSLSVTSGGKTTHFSFGRISSMKAYCSVDDRVEYVMDYEDLETLMSLADKLAAGETIQW